MNVLGVIPQYPPWSRVGSWITTHDHLAGMVQRGHTVNVVCIQTKEPPYELDGVHVWPNGTEVPQPDVVVSHLGDTGYGAHIAARLGVPSVRMVHGFHDDNAVRLEQHPTALAVFSSKALAADTGWDGPQMVAHPPIRPDDYQTTPGKAVTLANLSVVKGGLLLGWIAQAHPDVAFLGVRGWGQQITRQPPNVEVVDPVTDMRHIYGRTRILLMPSVYESYGRCAVEAACSGIPTIGHPSPGLVEAMGDAATWVDRIDQRGWIAAVGRLLNASAWRAASKRARGAIPTDTEATIGAVCDAIEALARVPA